MVLGRFRQKREPEELSRQELKQERRVVKHTRERVKRAAEYSQAKRRLREATEKHEIRMMKEKTKRLKPPSRFESITRTVKSELTPRKAKRKKKRRRRAAPRVRAGGPRYDPWDVSPW